MMDLLKEFESRIFGVVMDVNKAYLLAVSGGMDSMCLLNILHKANLSFEVAHCNFGLRGKECEGDEELVSEYCRSQGVQFHVKHFDLKGESNIQMKARELRYTWFQEIMDQRGLSGIITAHHNDDDLETFFINLLRGTGLKGLSGMDFIKGDIIRPLLFANSADIEAYVEQNKIEYRTDSSNISDKYLRNRVRHELLPLIEKIRPGSKEVLKRDQENIRIQLKDLERYYGSLRERIVSVEGEQVLINKNKLGSIDNSSGFLEFILGPLKFTRAAIMKISCWHELKIGKQFFTTTHVLTVDREALIIAPLKREEQIVVHIQEQDLSIDEPIAIQFKVFDKLRQFSQDETIAQFDLGKVEFPVLLRNWRQGDRFIPLGMTGSKLVSDLLIDNKMPRNEKEKTFVLCSGDKIMWVLGVRISEEFKVSDDTNKVWHCKMV